MLAKNAIQQYFEIADAKKVRKGKRASLVGVSRATLYIWEQALKNKEEISIRSDTLERVLAGIEVLRKQQVQN